MTNLVSGVEWTNETTPCPGVVLSFNLNGTQRRLGVHFPDEADREKAVKVLKKQALDMGAVVELPK